MLSLLRKEGIMAMRIRTAIIEDDKAAAQSLERHLDLCASKLDIRFEIQCFQEATGFLSDYKPVYDLIFMDIDLPHLNGMKAAERLRELDAEVILVFVTSLAQYAVQGYRVEALDFLVKPLKYFNVEMVLNRVVQKLNQHTGQLVMIRLPGETKAVPASRIAYVDVQDHYITFHTDSEDLRTKGTLQDVEKQLPKDSFFRCSRYCLVNLRSIEAIRRDTILVRGSEILLSRPRRKDLIQAYAEYAGGSLQ